MIPEAVIGLRAVKDGIDNVNEILASEEYAKRRQHAADQFSEETVAQVEKEYNDKNVVERGFNSICFGVGDVIQGVKNWFDDDESTTYASAKGTSRTNELYANASRLNAQNNAFELNDDERAENSAYQKFEEIRTTGADKYQPQTEDERAMCQMLAQNSEAENPYMLIKNNDANDVEYAVRNRYRNGEGADEWNNYRQQLNNYFRDYVEYYGDGVERTEENLQKMWEEFNKHELTTELRNDYLAKENKALRPKINAARFNANVQLDSEERASTNEKVRAEFERLRNTDEYKEWERQEDYIPRDAYAGAAMRDHWRANKPHFQTFENLYLAKEILDETERLKNRAVNGDGLGAGLADSVIDLDTWVAFKGLVDNVRIKQIADRCEEVGYDNLNADEKYLLDALAEQAFAEALYAEQLSITYKAGQVTGASLPFMIETALMAGTGVFKGVSGAVVQALKHRGLKAGVRLGAKTAGTMTRVAGKTAGGLSQAALHTVTFGMPRVLSETERRTTGDIAFHHEHGELKIDGFENQESYGGAFMRSLGNEFVNNYSELAFAPLGELRLAKRIVSKFPHLNTKQMTGNLNWMQRGINYVTKMRELSHVGGFIEEFSEEELGNLFGSIIDATASDNYSLALKEKLGDAFSFDAQVDLAVGLLPMQVFFGGTSAYSNHQRKRRNYQTNATVIDELEKNGYGDAAAYLKEHKEDLQAYTDEVKRRIKSYKDLPKGEREARTEQVIKEYRSVLETFANAAKNNEWLDTHNSRAVKIGNTQYQGHMLNKSAVFKYFDSNNNEVEAVITSPNGVVHDGKTVDLQGTAQMHGAVISINGETMSAEEFFKEHSDLDTKVLNESAQMLSDRYDEDMARSKSKENKQAENGTAEAETAENTENQENSGNQETETEATDQTIDPEQVDSEVVARDNFKKGIEQLQAGEVQHHEGIDGKLYTVKKNDDGTFTLHSNDKKVGEDGKISQTNSNAETLTADGVVERVMGKMTTVQSKRQDFDGQVFRVGNKLIIRGKRTATDERGRPLLDENGNFILVDHDETINCGDGAGDNGDSLTSGVLSFVDKSNGRVHVARINSASGFAKHKNGAIDLKKAAGQGATIVINGKAMSLARWLNFTSGRTKMTARTAFDVMSDANISEKIASGLQEAQRKGVQPTGENTPDGNPVVTDVDGKQKPVSEAQGKTPEQIAAEQQEAAKQQFYATLPKKRDGSVSYDKLTPEQEYQLEEYESGDGIGFLNEAIANEQSAIANLQSQLSSGKGTMTTAQGRAAIRNHNAKLAAYQQLLEKVAPKPQQTAPQTAPAEAEEKKVENKSENALSGKKKSLSLSPTRYDKTTVVVAPNRVTQMTSENRGELQAKASEFKRKAREIAKALGIKITNISTNTGGYQMQEGEHAGENLTELSYTFSLDTHDKELIELFACLVGDLGNEVQESVIAGKYLSGKGKENNDTVARELRIPITKNADVDAVAKILHENGFNDFTIDESGHCIKILQFPENVRYKNKENGNVTSEIEEEQIDQYDEEYFISEEQENQLEEQLNTITNLIGENYDGTRIPRYHLADTSLLACEDRQSIYETWLADSRVRGNTGRWGGIRTYVEQATQALNAYQEEVKLSEERKIPDEQSEQETPTNELSSSPSAETKLSDGIGVQTTEQTQPTTAFEKKGSSAINNTTDTAETDNGKRNDTATPQSTTSADKGTKNNSDGKTESGKSRRGQTAISSKKGIRKAIDKLFDGEVAGEFDAKLEDGTVCTFRYDGTEMSAVVGDEVITFEDRDAAKRFAKAEGKRIETQTPVEKKGEKPKKDNAEKLTAEEQTIETKTVSRIIDWKKRLKELRAAYESVLERIAAVGDNQEALGELLNELHELRRKIENKRKNNVRSGLLASVEKCIDETYEDLTDETSQELEELKEELENFDSAVEMKLEKLTPKTFKEEAEEEETPAEKDNRQSEENLAHLEKMGDDLSDKVLKGYTLYHIKGKIQSGGRNTFLLLRNDQTPFQPDRYEKLDVELLAGGEYMGEMLFPTSIVYAETTISPEDGSVRMKLKSLSLTSGNVRQCTNDGSQRLFPSGDAASSLLPKRETKKREVVGETSLEKALQARIIGKIEGETATDISIWEYITDEEKRKAFNLAIQRANNKRKGNQQISMLDVLLRVQQKVRVVQQNCLAKGLPDPVHRFAKSSDAVSFVNDLIKQNLCDRYLAGELDGVTTIAELRQRIRDSFGIERALEITGTGINEYIEQKNSERADEFDFDEADTTTEENDTARRIREEEAADATDATDAKNNDDLLEVQNKIDALRKERVALMQERKQVLRGLVQVEDKKQRIAEIDARTKETIDEERRLEKSIKMRLKKCAGQSNLSEQELKPILSRLQELGRFFKVPIKIYWTQQELLDASMRSKDAAERNSARAALNNLLDAKGWYSGGKVYIYMPNAEGVTDAVTTYVHEVVAHLGLRSLFGENYAGKMLELYDRSPRLQRYVSIKIRELQRQGLIGKKVTQKELLYAIDESLADLAESRMHEERAGVFHQLAHIIREWLYRLGERHNFARGYGWIRDCSLLKLGTQDLVDLLRQSAQHLHNEGANADRIRAAELSERTRFRNKKSFQPQNPQDLTTSIASMTGNAAKVQKNLEQLADSVKKNEIKNTKGFLGELKRALEIGESRINSGGASNYKRFVLPNGNKMSVRISNHNANANNYIGKRTEYDDNLSIVVKSNRSKNTFEANDNVIVEEFVYFKEQLNNSNDIASIAESLAAALETGEYIDHTGLARTNTSGVRFRIGNKRKANYNARLDKKRADLTAEERVVLFDYLDTLENSKHEAAVFDWFINGAVILPEDTYKIERALELIDKKKLDHKQYKTPTEIINLFGDPDKDDAYTNPDELPYLTKGEELPDGTVVYDMEDTEEAAKHFCENVMVKHFDRSPWCLMCWDNKGEWCGERYWHRHNTTGRAVAFKNGKPVAFFSSEDGKHTWWDFNDKPYYDAIPVILKVKGDKLGRSAIYEYHIADGIDYEKPVYFFKGSKKDGLYQEWNSEDKIIYLSATKHGKRIKEFKFDGNFCSYEDFDKAINCSEDYVYIDLGYKKTFEKNYDEFELTYNNVSVCLDFRGYANPDNLSHADIQNAVNKLYNSNTKRYY